MYFTIFHLLALIILLIAFVLICIIIFLKAKKKEIALVFYTINVIFISILIYSVFLGINQYITKASVDKITYTRDLRHENLIVTGRVQNLNKFNIKKCYLFLNISNQKQVGGEIFENKNLKNATMKNTSVSYTIEIIENLPGNTFKNFKAEVPFPPSFTNVEFYHTLKCI